MGVTKPDGKCLEEKNQSWSGFHGLALNKLQREDHLWCPSAQLIPHVKSLAPGRVASTTTAQSNSDG